MAYCDKERAWTLANAIAFRLSPFAFSSVFHVVLVEPEIPPNTGNIGRLCLATDAHLHLVEPLGFSIGDRALKRAGLDYWKDVRVSVWGSLAKLQEAQAADARYFYLTTKAQRPYWEASFRDGDFLVFGRETKGLPEPLLEAHREHLLMIPMTSQTRSLNLATAVGIVLYDAVRQVRAGA
jgi:tRNA (cytidine/uridine-2'-O-)-methyltransferase